MPEEDPRVKGQFEIDISEHTIANDMPEAIWKEARTRSISTAFSPRKMSKSMRPI